jgi:chromate transporter
MRNRLSRRPAPAAEPGAPAGTASFGAYLRYFVGLGIWGFGGPIASVGYMQRDLVERRCWLTEAEFLDGVALGQTMPGPLAAQVVMWIGYLRKGWAGALAAAAAFIAPSFLLVLAVAVIYVRYSGLAIVQSLFYGIAPAVMAIIAIAAWKLARLTNRGDRRLWAISLVLAIVTAVSGAEIAVLFIAAGLVMIALDAPPRWLRRDRTAALIPAPVLVPAAGMVPRIAGILARPWIAVAASAGVLLSLALFFLKAGAFIFGSGLAIVPFLRQGVVVQHHSIPGRWFVRHRDHPQINAFVKGATAAAAAAGAIAGAVVVLTRRTVTDLPTAAIAAISLGLLLWKKIPEPVFVALGGLAGILLH